MGAEEFGIKSDAGDDPVEQQSRILACALPHRGYIFGDHVNSEVWVGAMASDRVVRFDRSHGQMTEYFNREARARWIENDNPALTWCILQSRQAIARSSEFPNISTL